MRQYFFSLSIMEGVCHLYQGDFRFRDGISNRFTKNHPSCRFFQENNQQVPDSTHRASADDGWEIHWRRAHSGRTWSG